MADEDDSFALVFEFFEVVKAFTLEVGITDGEDFVH